VLMAAGNREHPRPRHVAVAVRATRAVAIVRNVPAEHRGKTELPFDLAQDQHAAIRRHDSFPPSNVAVIVFPPTGDRPGRNSVASVMVSGASCWPCTIFFDNRIIREPAGLVPACFAVVVMPSLFTVAPNRRAGLSSLG